MNFRKQILVILILGSIILLPNISFSQIKSYPFEQIDSLQKIEKRNVIVFIHTDWCKSIDAKHNL
jgi:hypothetical protein